MKPRLLDLFCGAGGAAMGYHRAGFEVVGVDIKPQPHYPFEFHQMDAMAVLRGINDASVLPIHFDAIHASPPCQLYSTVGKQSAKKLGTIYPDLVGPTREGLQATGMPWVIENVVGAPLHSPVTLCGSWFGLDLRQHRLFETGGFGLLLVPPCSHNWQTPRFRILDKRRTKAVSVVAVYGTGAHTAPLSSVVGVHDHVNYTGEKELREKAMGIDWMTPYELTQAIPPAYTEWIGRQLLRVIEQSGPVHEGAFHSVGAGPVRAELLDMERCPYCGHRQRPFALNMQEALELRARYRRGWAKQALAAAYRISVRTVERYLRRVGP